MVTTILSACNSEPAKNERPDSASVEVGNYANLPELEIEEVGLNAVLPAQYPSSYMFAHNMNFYSIIDGNINIIDVAADTFEFKGMINAAQMASFAQSKNRQELYVAETYYARGTHGERTDVISIYDNSTLILKDEIVLPGRKRGLSVIQKGSFQLIDNEKYAVVSNFTPASSVSIIDLTSREIVKDIPTPGCSLTFPLNGAAFATLCGNGGVSSFILQDGEVVQSMSEPFNDVENDAMFLKSAQIENIRYFPTFTGNVRPIHVGGLEAKPLKPWSLVTDSERTENWRPSGWQVITAQQNGNLFVLMQKDGHEGSHKSGGSEVWVFDVKEKKKIRTIQLPKGGLSIEVTNGSDGGGHLVVTNLEMGLDVFSLTGALERTIIVNDTATPFLLHAAK